MTTLKKSTVLVGIALIGGISFFIVKRPNPQKNVPLQKIAQEVIDNYEKAHPTVPLQVPQEVTDKKTYKYSDEFSMLPLDGKPHYESTKADKFIDKNISVGFPSPYAAKMGIGWFGEYPQSDGVWGIVSGVGRVAVIGTKRTYKHSDETSEEVYLYLAVEPKAVANRIGTAGFRVPDALTLARHLEESIRIAKKIRTEKLSIVAYPRRFQVGKMWCFADGSLIISVDQQSSTAPPMVNFSSTFLVYDKYYHPLFYNKLLVYTNRLDDVDTLRRQINRVGAWLENRPYTP